MKCPKCDYLGFETGDRCKNCGYDFSLLTGAAAHEIDLPLREPDSLDSPLRITLDPMLASASPNASADKSPRAGATAAVSLAKSSMDALPLFTPDAIEDDTPLIKMPAAPRAPLSVRRTPDVPRARMAHKSTRRASAQAVHDLDPLLSFGDESATEPVAPVFAKATTGKPTRRVHVTAPQTSGAIRRAMAAIVDHSILLGVDVIVLYFTLRLAGITGDDWRSIPIAPMALFLLLIKIAYFCVFTLFGGQTIGKMAARIRVVADDDAPLDPPRAIRRTFAGLVSAATLGVGFLPAFIASDHRALHDRLARTRVITI